MDNLAHTLAGAALGEAGLKRKTGLGLATLMIAANLPDLDAIAYFTGESLTWRRGWTHGPIGLLVLPMLLAALVVGFDRWQARRGMRPDGRQPVIFGWTLALAYIGALSHPALDYLNSYGVRLLMPFSERWYYGDALFIIDIWIWSLLGLGVFLARRRRSRGRRRPEGPAIAALAGVTAYSLAMSAGSLAAERTVAGQVAQQGLGTPAKVVANPVPIDPFRRRVVYQLGSAYGFADFNWLGTPRVRLPAMLIPTNMQDPAVARAAATHDHAADFLYWSRLPFAFVDRKEGQTEVTIGDARYNETPSDGAFSVRAILKE